MKSGIDKAIVFDIDGKLIVTVELEAVPTVTELQNIINRNAGIPIVEQRLLLGEHVLCCTDLVASILGASDEKNITLVRVQQPLDVITTLGVMGIPPNTTILYSHWKFKETSRIRIKGIQPTSSFEDLVLAVGAEMAKTSDEELKESLRYILQGQAVQTFRDAVVVGDRSYLTERLRLLTSTKKETLHGGGAARWTEFGLVSLSQLDQRTVDTLPVGEDEGTRVVKMYVTCDAPHEVEKISQGSCCTII